ncbi:DinB family protein [Bizionia arctica]|uniref:DNA damage-inducible protein DinB n=1 Tax=Bizionia arctica TaxID=1495645 RepID=A0A917GJV9_9FLAO|nr:DinB family protein [Bizionia arctica]GGG48572.1 DNA damage-inducible protein DinB [Bizionia arctica]
MYVNDLLEKEYGEFYANYVKLAGSKDLISGIASSLQETLTFLKSIPDDKLEYRYQEAKWTIKDVIQHMIDTERIFAYRALRFARRDTVSLAGFEENAYASVANANDRTRKDLFKEYQLVRESTLMLFKGMDVDMLMQIGEASGVNMSVRAIGFVTIGHEKHHCQIIESRYL